MNHKGIIEAMKVLEEKYPLLTLFLVWIWLMAALFAPAVWIAAGK